MQLLKTPTTHGRTISAIVHQEVKMPPEMQLILAGLFGVLGLAVALYATFVLEAEELLRRAEQQRHEQWLWRDWAREDDQ